ncbi:MAG: sensor histidine kinase [Flavobacteriales bacterium]|nr:sensor histidine kinase [Flavobacteriales bacterium]
MSWLQKNKKTLLLATLGALGSCFLFNSEATLSLKGFLLRFIWSWVIWTTQWFGNGYLGDFLTKKISWTEKPLLRAVAGIAGLVVYSLLAFSVVHVMMSFIMLDASIMESIKWLGVNAIKYVLIFSGSIGLVVHTIWFFMNWKESKIEAEKLRAEMKTYQYDALRNQINPHFLFNSFNVLSELVYEDQDLAVKFIRQLSDLYRYVLDSKDLELVSLQDEIDFIKKFSFLLQTRFEKNLEIDIRVEAAHDELIVPMSLQLLLENAVKHNEISNEYPLKVDIHRNADSIQVKNSLKKKTNPESSTKTGLQNIIKRYKYLSEKKILIEETKDEFIVEIPVLKGDLS